MCKTAFRDILLSGYLNSGKGKLADNCKHSCHPSTDCKDENVEKVYKQNCQEGPIKHDPVEHCKVSLQYEARLRITGEYLEHTAYSSESVRQLLTNEQDQQQYLATKITAVFRHLPYSRDLTPYNCFQ